MGRHELPMMRRTKLIWVVCGLVVLTLVFSLAAMSFGVHWGPVTLTMATKQLRGGPGTVDDFQSWAEQARWDAVFLPPKGVPLSEIVPTDHRKIEWVGLPADPLKLRYTSLICSEDTASWLRRDSRKVTIWIYFDDTGGAIRGWYVEPK